MNKLLHGLLLGSIILAPLLPSAHRGEAAPVLPPTVQAAPGEGEPGISPSLAVRTPSPRWKILVLIYVKTDFTYTDTSGAAHRIIATMTPTEKEQAAAAATQFVTADIPALTSQNMLPLLTIRYPERTLTELEPFGEGWWPSPVNTAPERDPAFDSVLVIWDPEGIDQTTGNVVWYGGAAGLALGMGTAQTYVAIALANRNVLKHEWGHSIASYFEAAGTAPTPSVNNHEPGQYVHCPTGTRYVLEDETDAQPIPNSIYNNDSGFTHDFYSGTVATADQPTRCLGITPQAWALGGPVSKPGDTPPPTPRQQVVVGAGTAASCTAEALTAALAAVATGGAVVFSCGPDSVTITVPELTLTRDITIDGGRLVSLSGGGLNRIFSVSAGVTAVLRNLIVRSGRAHSGSGVWNAGVLTVRDTTLTASDAQNVRVEGSQLLNAAGASLRVVDSTISDGGTGITNLAGGTLIVQHSRIAGNVGQTGGGIDNRGDATVRDSTIADNRVSGSAHVAGGDGGGIFNTGTLSIKDSTISGNHAGSTPPTGAVGGGIANGGTLTIVGTRIVKNTVGGTGGVGGGGIWNTGPLTVRDSAVVENSVSGRSNIRGGGIYTAAGSASAPVLLHNTTVSRNTLHAEFTTSLGGGIYNAGWLTVSEAAVNRNTVTAGSASRDAASAQGGGIFTAPGGSTLLTKSTTVERNTVTATGIATATAQGGGLANDRGTLELRDSWVNHNTAAATAATVTIQGGGLFNGGKLTLTNTPVENNAPDNTFTQDPGPFMPGSIISLQSHNYPHQFIHNTNGLGYITTNNGTEQFRQDATWVVRVGLADPSAVSLESFNHPGRFLHGSNGRLRIDPDDGSALFRNYATWRVRPGLADSTKASFESFVLPGQYFRHRNAELWLDPNDGSDLYRRDATFAPVKGLAAP